MANKIKLRNGTASAWDSANPTLLAGEPGFETDTRKWKLGDGSTAWGSLEYWNYPKVAAKTANYTIVDDDADVFEVTTSTTDRTITLPTLADNAGRVIRVIKVDDASGKVILDGEGAETIDGETTIDIDSQYDYAVVFGGTSSWILMDYYDHGSNTNGFWERTKDSISCWNTVTSTASNYATWTYPKALTTIDSAWGNSLAGEGTGVSVTIGTVSTTSLRFGLIVMTTGAYWSSTGSVGLEVRGRWR
jgi:hypothetical protein